MIGRVKNVSVATAKNSPGFVPAYERRTDPPVPSRTARYSAVHTSTQRRRSVGVVHRRRAVDRAVEHVQLVAELVEHDVAAEARVARLAAGGRPHEHDRAVGVVGLAVDGAGGVHQHALRRSGHRGRAAHRPAAHDDRADAVERRRRRGRGRAGRRGRRRACAPRRSAPGPWRPPSASCARRGRPARRGAPARRASSSGQCAERAARIARQSSGRPGRSRWKRRTTDPSQSPSSRPRVRRAVRVPDAGQPASYSDGTRVVRRWCGRRRRRGPRR